MEGTPFGRYRLLQLLGRGGMGEVWRAFDTGTQRVVAVKVLSAALAADPVFEERFRREAMAAAGLNDPHIVPIHDFGEIDGRLFVNMRLIEGRDLTDIIAAGPLRPERAAYIVEQVASALHAAHRIGLVHRDVKPSNILIAENDFAYLIDFGIARAAGETGLTSTGAAVGTWAYMAPERITAGQTDPRCDIYALACVLHECVTGQQPYPGNSFEQLAAAHMWTPPPRPSVVRSGITPALDTVIATGLAKNPDERYATTNALAHAARAAVSAPTRLPIQPATQRAPLPIPSATQRAPVPIPPTSPASPWSQTGYGAPTNPPLTPAPAQFYGAPPTPATPPADARSVGRRGIVIAAAAAAVVILVAAMLFVTKPWENTSAAPSGPAEPAANFAPIPGCGGVSDQKLSEATKVANLVNARNPVGCQWLANGSIIGPHFSFTWFRGSPTDAERKVQEATRATVEDTTIDGHPGWIATADLLCEVGIQLSSADDWIEWSISFDKPPSPDPCEIAKDLSSQSIAAIADVPMIGLGTPAANSPPAQLFPNLDKECEPLGPDVIAKTVGAKPIDIQSTFVGAVCRWQALAPGGIVDIVRYRFETGSLDNERSVAERSGYDIEDRTIAGVTSIVLRPKAGSGVCGVVGEVGGVVGWWVNAPSGIDACGQAIAMMESTLAR